MKKKKALLALIVIITAFLIASGIHQLRTVDIAHSSFENYYAFRGCVQLLEKTDTYGICKTASGKTIKIVLYNGKWYLDRDLPGVW
jgi:hypothetical protein